MTWTTIEMGFGSKVSHRVFTGPHDRHGAWSMANDMCFPDTTLLAIVPGNHSPHSEHNPGDALRRVSEQILIENS